MWDKNKVRLSADLFLRSGAYSRNKRGIGGTLIWINFDRHALLNLIQQAASTFVADEDEIRPQYRNVSSGSAVFQSSVVRDAGPSIAATIDQLNLQTISSTGQLAELASPWYSDQILPFDITLTGVNEMEEGVPLAASSSAARHFHRPDSLKTPCAMTGVIAAIKALHAAGKRNNERVAEPDIHISGNTAWIAYVNKGSTTDASGTVNQNWLESAFLEKQAGTWKIVFMHSTRVPMAAQQGRGK